MSWQDIVKVGRPDVPIEEAGPGDMEEHERSMLRNEKYGSPHPKMTDKESSSYGRALDMHNIVKLIEMSMDDLDKDLVQGYGMGEYELPQEAKKAVRKLVLQTAQTMVKQAEEDMAKWRTASHWEGVL
tara:strand:+ start:435 stop:818 length:384 start_codon:yes stop_codon:yes gene_type:complete